MRHTGQHRRRSRYPQTDRVASERGNEHPVYATRIGGIAHSIFTLPLLRPGFPEALLVHRKTVRSAGVQLVACEKPFLIK